MKTFNEIYILDLHGNAKKKEKSPDGSKDENVFEIPRGVAIALFIKKKDAKDSEVYHSEAWGVREKKYEFLLVNDIKTTEWKKLEPNSPYYFFVPRDEKGREIYESFAKVTEIFKENVTGIVTARDSFVIDFNKETLYSKIKTFLDERISDDDIKKFLKEILGRTKIEDVENYAWRVSDARQELRRVKDLEKYFTKILYRPFDVRYIFYHDSVVWRTRKDIMQHMLAGENLGLITCRQAQNGFRHAFVSDKIVEFNLTGTAGRYGSGYLFPLYLHTSTDKNEMFKDDATISEREPNISPELFDKLSQSYGKSPTPEEIFYYIYAVLYSNIYRTKYAEFLKIDFPRVPFTSDYNLFIKLSDLGEELVNLHLLKSPKLDNPIAKYGGKGNDAVVKVQYNESEKCVYINANNYFENVEPKVYSYYIGGYQVLNKWLKDRVGRILSLSEIETYCKIVTALSETLTLQSQLDSLYPEVEKTILEIKSSMKEE